MPLYSRTKKLLLSQYELAETLLSKMRARYPNNTLTLTDSDNPDDIYIDIKYPNGQTLTCCTESLYMAYKQAPHRLNDHYAHMLETLDTLVQDDESLEQMLLPVILNQDRIDDIQNKYLQGKRSGILPESKTLCYCPLVADLYIAYVIDNSHQLYYLYEEQLSHFSAIRSKEEIAQLALANLQKKVDDLRIHTSPLGISLHLDSEYESSMLLIYELWKDRLQLTGEPVIAIAARDTVLIVNSEDKTSVVNLQKMAQGIYEKIPSATSAQLFTIREGRLCIYHMPD